MHTVGQGASPFLEQLRYLDMEEEEKGKVLEGWGRVRWLQTGLPPLLSGMGCGLSSYPQPQFKPSLSHSPMCRALWIGPGWVA